MVALSEKLSNHRGSNHISVLFVGVLAMLLFACSGTTGVLKPDPQVMESFGDQQVLPNHRYYHLESNFGDSGILAVDNKYVFNAKLWQPIDTTTNELSQLVRAMKKKGSRLKSFELQGPDGQRLGILLANNNRYTVRVASDASFQVISIGLSSQEQIGLIY